MLRVVFDNMDNILKVIKLKYPKVVHTVKGLGCQLLVVSIFKNGYFRTEVGDTWRKKIKNVFLCDDIT